MKKYNVAIVGGNWSSRKRDASLRIGIQFPLRINQIAGICPLGWKNSQPKRSGLRC